MDRVSFGYESVGFVFGEVRKVATEEAALRREHFVVGDPHALEGRALRVRGRLFRRAPLTLFGLCFH